jgi:hypothetical protein
MTPAWPNPSRVSWPACIVTLARSKPTRISSSSRSAISSGGSFTERYEPPSQSEMWMIGKPASIRRHAVTNRCEEFSSARRRPFMPQPRPRGVAQFLPDKPSRTRARNAPALASIESDWPSSGQSSLRDIPPPLPTPRRDVPANMPRAHRRSRETQHPEIPLPKPFP